MMSIEVNGETMDEILDKMIGILAMSGRLHQIPAEGEENNDDGSEES